MKLLPKDIEISIYIWKLNFILYLIDLVTP